MPYKLAVILKNSMQFFDIYDIIQWQENPVEKSRKIAGPIMF